MSWRYVVVLQFLDEILSHTVVCEMFITCYCCPGKHSRESDLVQPCLLSSARRSKICEKSIVNVLNEKRGKFVWENPYFYVMTYASPYGG